MDTPEQTTPLSKAELLEALVEAKFLETSENWDNLTIAQLQFLLDHANSFDEDHPVIKKAIAENDSHREQLKEDLSKEYGEKFTAKMKEIEDNFTKNAKKADPANVKKLKEDHEKALSDEVIKRRLAEQKNKESFAKIQGLVNQLSAALK